MLARALALALLAILAVAGSSDAALTGPSPHHGKSRLKAFADCHALVRYARRHLRTELGPSPQPGFGAPEGRPAVGEPAAGEGGSSSTTNVQEAGVDEPDIVKSRGSTIFALEGGALQAVDTSGGAPRLVDSLDLKGGADQLLVSGDRALAIGGGYGGGVVGIDGMASSAPSYYGDSGIVLTEIDISDASAMRVVNTEKIDGNYLSARLSGNTARVVLSVTPSAIYKPKLRRRARGWRPSGTVRNARTGRKKKRALGSCSSIMRPKEFSGLDALTVLTIDMGKGLPHVDSDSILTDGDLVYASPRNLYVATQRWLDQPSSGNQEPPPVTTAIHKFDAAQAGETSYRASGSVTGSLLSQWSMSDHDGALRVASTDSPEWWDGPPKRESQSFVTVLAEEAGQLVQTGRVGDLGKGERIYAVRFVGDTGYVVTFRQVDPLYTLDLSAPTHPRVAGELKIRGYSAYLHPIGSDLLLGVGQDADERGWTLGTQLSLFDVSDPANPARLHHRVIADSGSDVEYDHHAFLWWSPSKLAVLPLMQYNGDGFYGAIGFRVDRSGGIEELGRAAHQGDAMISRSLVVDGRLFTLSYGGIEMNSLDTLARLAWVPFPQPDAGSGGGGGSVGGSPSEPTKPGP
jgi:Beta propeller domain